MDNIKEDMNVVFVGHVDHGKSTIVGRLLADTNSLPTGKLEQVRESCRRNSKPFEYAFLLDALKDEQAQGITIDAARCFFKTEKRNYIIIDAPGHIEFLKNMVTGASRAEAALLVIDANEGVKENSKRHGFLLSMLGIKQITVLVNKMDLVDFSESKFNQIVSEYTDFLNEIAVKPVSFIPISGFNGDNVASISGNMKWYKGNTVLDCLDSFQKEVLPFEKPFRMPVQDVYKFTKNGDSRRIISGTVISGRIKAGDEVVFYPSGKCSKVKILEEFSAPVPEYFTPGKACGFTLEEQIYITRGEIAVLKNESPVKVTSRFKCNIFWLGKDSMEMEKKYYLKVGSTKIGVQLDEIIRVMDASTLNNIEKKSIERHDVAECILRTDRAIAFDLVDYIQETSRFVIVDDYEISGGGIITLDMDDSKQSIRENLYIRESKWNRSEINQSERSEIYNHKACLVIITGDKACGKKKLAKSLEKTLFRNGKITYYLSMANIKYGVDADISMDTEKDEEHIRRLAEVANIMLDAGLILVVTVLDLNRSEYELIQTTIEDVSSKVIWVGKEVTTDIPVDMKIDDTESVEKSVDKIKMLLQNSGVIFNV